MNNLCFMSESKIRQILPTVFGGVLVASTCAHLTTALAQQNSLTQTHSSQYSRLLNGAPEKGHQQNIDATVEIALPPLSPEEKEKLKPPREDGPMPGGVHRLLPEGIEQNPKAWHKTPDGDLWRMRIISPGATSLRVYFKNFNIHNGQLWLYGADGQVDGPYTGRGLFDEGQFWSAPIFSDHITIEYKPDPQHNNTKPVPFRMIKLSHSVI